MVEARPLSGIEADLAYWRSMYEDMLAMECVSPKAMRLVEQTIRDLKALLREEPDGSMTATTEE